MIRIDCRASAVFASRTGVTIRVGAWRIYALKRGREYWSERNRIDWRVTYLPFGWRFSRRGTR